jgi:DNA-binding MarR family transcriptional regulator
VNSAKANGIPDEAMIFGLLMMISNKMSTLLEREFKEFDVTTKLWFLAETLHSLFDSPPTLKEAANAMGSSHQNVKQVAMKLQEKGLLLLQKDKKDARITRLRMTERGYVFLNQMEPKGSVFRENLFHGMHTEDIAKTRNLLEGILFNLSEIENVDVNAEDDT